MKPLSVIDLGLTDYKSIWDLQHRLFDLRASGAISDTLLLNEHKHVYTLGKSSDDNHLLADAAELQKTGAEVFHIDRGGDVTYHGPGQLVGYPILDLNNYYLDLHRYLRDIEEVIIRTLADYGVEAGRDERYTGVWVRGEKIAAIGVKVSRWITMHGFAFNVNTDLSYFGRIIPCGIFHKGVTSLERLMGKKTGLSEVQEHIVKHFGSVFGAEPTFRPTSDLLTSIDPIHIQ
ncbi:MAG TPA: lipoyl(octanoyl) transferase LipB [Bacteroidota bacterium]|jgi:lipoyl(octanoyl) transferase|nr:lipoyl(octanoyl) transferase LipB [Bacteroidota bacterium]